MRRPLLLSLLPAFLTLATPATRGAASDFLARWTFDESDGPRCADVSGHASHASLRTAIEGATRIRGIHGRAIHLRGAHALAAVLRDLGDSRQALGMSVWIRPTDLSGYREILRHEGPHRILFSFQEGGTILSLGLDIGGYVECDARLDPAEVLDGQWHHAAASFDGEWMRVFLDGREIGSLHRPGVISLTRDPVGFIGSSTGSSEHFQGSLDDLRLEGRMLDSAAVAEMHREGTAALAMFARETAEAIRPVYPDDGTFANVVSMARQRLAGMAPDRRADLAQAVQARLRRDFPADFARFVRYTHRQPAEFLCDPSPDLGRRLVAHLVDLALEYRPLTEHQWNRQTPEQTRHWQTLDRFRERQEQLAARGSESAFSADWVELALDVGSHIPFRPSTHEPVAPYVPPATPETRSPSAAEAQAALERDWLHQAGGSPTRERARLEIRWARELAQRLLAGTHAPDLSRELAALDAFQQRLGMPQSSERELYLKVRQTKRDIALRNPVLDFTKVVLVDMPLPQGSEWTHETRHRLGYMAVPGARLMLLDGLRPDGAVRQLMPQAPLHGSFWRPDVSWDGQRVLFCYKPHNEKSFHLYEIGADGSGLQQLTDGPFDDLDPVYLPDERHIVFSTTRANTYVRCMPPTSAFVLARCRRDGSGIYLISANNEPDYLPSVLDDGRLLYTRWEYTDKPLWRAQKLWTVNPDGTQVLMYWGNQSVWPDVMKDARGIPGSRRVMFTGSAHHNWFAGSVGIIDPDQGFNFPWGLTKVTADTEWPECGNGPVDPVESPHYHASGRYEAYYSPFPLSEQDFLVSANRGGKFALYLMDTTGNRELLYEGTHHVLHAMPLRPRPRPPVLPDRVTWPTAAEREHPAEGVVFSSDVYQGAPEALRGKAKFLRVLTIDAKTYTYWYKRPYISTGPVVSAVQSEGVKRLLGTVPIEADGSVAFRAPAMLPLHFQLLDEQQRALQTMRSFVHVMPGERRGCLGCHESNSRTTESPRASGPLALQRAPREITPPPWPDRTVSFPRYVRPVLDRYCAKCHEGDGEGRKTLDLTERPSSPVFTEPYLTLVGRPSWGAPYQPPQPPPPGFGMAGTLLVEAYGTLDPQAYVTPPPMSGLSHRSKLIELVTSGNHHQVKVDEISRLRLIAWIDAMCPFLGDEEIREIPDPEFQGIDWLAVRPRIRTAPRITRPGPLGSAE